MKKILTFILLFSTFFAANAQVGNNYAPGAYNVLLYNIKNDSSADITLALQNLINFVPTGSTIYFPPGKYRQDNTDTIGVGKKIRLLGPSSAITNNGLTWAGTQPAVIYHGNLADTAFRNEAYGTEFENLSIQCSASGTPTGRGLYFHQGGYVRVTHCVAYNFGCNLEIKNGGEWKVEDFYSINARGTDGVLLQDSTNHDNGDAIFINSFISNFGGPTVTNGVTWISGGGIRFKNNKLNGGMVNGFNGPFVGTIDGEISGNGFENYTGSAIKMVLPAGGAINNLLIQNNYMDGTGLGGHILLDGSGVGSTMQSVNVSGNVIYGSDVDTAIVVKNLFYSTIGINTFRRNKLSVYSNTPFSNQIAYAFAEGYQRQALTETGTTVTMDMGYGTVSYFTITQNDTLRIPNNYAVGASFKIYVTQDGTGSHNLILPGFAINYQGWGTGSGSNVLALDPRPAKTTLIEGYINANNQVTIANVVRYIDKGAIPFMSSVTNGFTEDTARFLYRDDLHALQINLNIAANHAKSFQLNGGMWMNKDSAVTVSGGSNMMVVIDTATGFIGKQVIPTGGSTFGRQVITSGTSATVTGGNYLVTFDFSTATINYTLTLPASPNDLDQVAIESGGTLTTGKEINSFTVSPNSGQSIVGTNTVSTLDVGGYYIYQYRAANSTWYRHL